MLTGAFVCRIQYDLAFICQKPDLGALICGSIAQKTVDGIEGFIAAAYVRSDVLGFGVDLTALDAYDRSLYDP